MTSSSPPSNFKPALIIVDLQEDFCPPNGTLAVPGGRAIAPLINTLLTYPFIIKIATKDWHPADHVSFASNHPPPNNIPFESTFTIKNPDQQGGSETIRLWPDHCVQGTKGAELISELNTEQIHEIVLKGSNSRTEMYSAFYDTFVSTESDSGLGKMLRDGGVSHVFVVGLAFNFCVKWTALHAAKEGFATFVVQEATRVVDAGSWEGVVKELRGEGVEVVGVDGEVVGWVRGLKD